MTERNSLIGDVTINPATNFVAADYFKIDTGENAPVKIKSVGESIVRWVFGKTEKQEVGQVVLRYQPISVSAFLPSIDELGGEAKTETTLAEIYALLEKHAKGEDEGALLVSGYEGGILCHRANIFCVRNIEGVLGAVYVYWNEGGGWNLANPSRSNPCSHFSVYRMFTHA